MKRSCGHFSTQASHPKLKFRQSCRKRFQPQCHLLMSASVCLGFYVNTPRLEANDNEQSTVIYIPGPWELSVVYNYEFLHTEQLARQKLYRIELEGTEWNEYKGSIRPHFFKNA
jgi:hypothetical protein